MPSTTALVVVLLFIAGIALMPLGLVTWIHGSAVRSDTIEERGQRFFFLGVVAAFAASMLFFFG